MDHLSSKEIELYNQKMGKEEREPAETSLGLGWLLHGQRAGLCQIPWAASATT